MSKDKNLTEEERYYNSLPTTAKFRLQEAFNAFDDAMKIVKKNTTDAEEAFNTNEKMPKHLLPKNLNKTSNDQMTKAWYKLIGDLREIDRSLLDNKEASKNIRYDAATDFKNDNFKKLVEPRIQNAKAAMVANRGWNALETFAKKLNDKISPNNKSESSRRNSLQGMWNNAKLRLSSNKDAKRISNQTFETNRKSLNNDSTKKSKHQSLKNDSTPKPRM